MTKMISHLRSLPFRHLDERSFSCLFSSRLFSESCVVILQYLFFLFVLQIVSPLLHPFKNITKLIKNIRTLSIVHVTVVEQEPVFRFNKISTDTLTRRLIGSFTYDSKWELVRQSLANTHSPVFPNTKKLNLT